MMNAKRRPAMLSIPPHFVILPETAAQAYSFPAEQVAMMEREFKLYGFTMHYLRLLAEDVTEEQMTDIPAPGLNHPAWFIGHLAVCADFVPKLLSQPTICPPEWDALFAPGSVPTTNRSRYPSKAELLAKNEEAFVRNPKLIAEASERRLAMPHGIEYFTPLYPTIGDMIAHLMATHPAWHLGQFSTWRRLHGLKGVMAFP